MDFLEEIEFFGFVPVTYVNNLIKNTTEKLEELLKEEDPLVKKEIMTALNKNFQIFEVYVLKSIFKFPESFSFERKITDYTCETDLNDLIVEYTRILEEEDYLKNEIAIKEKELEVKMIESKEYDILLDCEEELKGVVQKIQNMEDTSLEAEKSYKRLCQQTNSIVRKNHLTDCKDLKDAMWEREKCFLFENVSLSQIQFYNRNI